MSSMKTILYVALFLLLVACNQPRPVQQECVKYRTCASCVSAYCGYCGNGCFSFQSELICEEPIGFVQSCTDGTAPFPDIVVNPMPYGKARASDGGVGKTTRD
jgi:hypothetical protein